jgi:hypothetical protein
MPTKSPGSLADVMRHPHYPGRGLRCDAYWCEPPLWERREHEEDGRWPYVLKPKGT